MRRGKCTGVHGGTGHLIIVYENEKGYQQEYRLDDAIDPEHEAQYSKLCAAVIEAETARRAFEKDHAFDVKERIAKFERKGGA